MNLLNKQFNNFNPTRKQLLIAGATVAAGLTLSLGRKYFNPLRMEYINIDISEISIFWQFFTMFQVQNHGLTSFRSKLAKERFFFNKGDDSLETKKWTNKRQNSVQKKNSLRIFVFIYLVL